ncbi:hypothetical protein [Chitinophaga japonensis]|uniref:Uncharacterized protein n=1 Tax=Chitinophaga japonensis TaxID=104662 RepID=A0A562TC12_CHIJA|nr:hypothetical protein [Chitinophaga japonensis]TWI90923.1 hypothetical protein LX66_0284 [Chitinophaga japonensis]
MNDRIQELTELVTRHTRCACVYHKQEHSISFNESRSILAYTGLALLFLAATLVSALADVVLYIGSMPLPWWIYLFPMIFFLALVFISGNRSGITLLLLEQELRSGKLRIPFSALQQDQLSLQRNAGSVGIWIQHPQLRKRLCSFEGKDAALAEKCYHLLQTLARERVKRRNS